jgi:hypothetical protein
MPQVPSPESRVPSPVRVDFYEMSGRFTDPLFVAGVLVSRAWPETRSIAVVASKRDLQMLDRQMWEKPDGRFLPHGIDDDKAPIKLLEDAPDEAGILINLDPDRPATGRPLRAHPRNRATGRRPQGKVARTLGGLETAWRGIASSCLK